ncbi:methyltransferase domain-containing protein [Candidatus Gracilibacteria bacterium]|nr:methyltransferase domain-containing protein [Candidatus Gracilibacteria bacterium]
MSNTYPSCEKKSLHQDLRDVFLDLPDCFLEGEELKKNVNVWYVAKGILLAYMESFGYSKYNAMGILGYRTHLLTSISIKKIIEACLGKKKIKNLLDIGAGSGTVTEKFEQYTESISCIEPSESFQKILCKKGYKIVDENDIKLYEIITMFNVLDRCEKPLELLKKGINALSKRGIIMVSLPLPTDNYGKIYSSLSLSEHATFESATNELYNILRGNGLKIKAFSCIPYIVLLPNIKYSINYQNALFICSKQK